MPGVVLVSLLLLFRSPPEEPAVVVTGMFDEPTPDGSLYDEPTPTASFYDEPTPGASMYDEPTPS